MNEKILFINILLVLFSCKKECKECYLIEKDSDGNTTLENHIGEKCGKDIDETEDYNYVVPDKSSTVYNECR